MKLRAFNRGKAISALPIWIRIADSVHKVFSSTFEHFPNGRGEHPFRIARMSAIDVGIHAIRAGRHLCDEALRYLWTGTSRHFHRDSPIVHQGHPQAIAIPTQSLSR